MPRRIGRMVISVWLALLFAATPAGAALLFLRPELPPAVQPDDDQAMRDLIEDDYQWYFSEITIYLRCVEQGQIDAEREVKAIIERWEREFGE